MEETGSSILTKRPRLTIRISQSGMSFSVVDNLSDSHFEAMIYSPQTGSGLR